MAHDIKQPPVKKFRISDIEMADYNPREISEVALDGLRDSIKAFKMLEVPVVNISEGKARCVSGHQRLKALAAEGFEFADCGVVDFDEVTEMTANLAMNNPATQGHWNPSSALEQINVVMEEIPRPNMARFDALQDEIRATLPRPEKPKASDSGKAPPKEPKSQPGNVYKLGDHRLLCGDVLEPGAALNLMRRKKANACISDPPYNVDYQDGAIQNDDMDEDAWTGFLTAICKTILKITKGPCYLFMASKHIPRLHEAWRVNGGEVHKWLVWVKDRFTLGRSDYQHQYEPVLYGGKAGVVLKNPKAKTNVLEFPKPSVNVFHPTQKPVDLIKAVMEDASDEGDIVFDPFGGSGTTLVAAEEMGRVCYTAEISTAFCDTIRERWAEQAHGAGSDWEDLTPVVYSA